MSILTTPATTKDDFNATQRMHRIEEVCEEIHLESLCVKRAWAIGEHDPHALIQPIQVRMWEKWPAEFDHSDRPWPDRPGLSAQSWANVVARNVLSEQSKDMLKAGIHLAPKDMSVDQIDDTTFDITYTDTTLDFWTVAGLYQTGRDDDSTVKRIGHQLDPKHNPLHVYDTALTLIKRLEKACETIPNLNWNTLTWKLDHHDPRVTEIFKDIITHAINTGILETSKLHLLKEKPKK